MENLRSCFDKLQADSPQLESFFGPITGTTIDDVDGDKELELVSAEQSSDLVWSSNPTLSQVALMMTYDNPGLFDRFLILVLSLENRLTEQDRRHAELRRRMLDAPDDTGITVFDVAVLTAGTAHAEILLDAGADPRYLSEEHGHTAAELAAVYYYCDVYSPGSGHDRIHILLEDRGLDAPEPQCSCVD